MIEIKCPKCGSKNFDCYDTDFDLYGGTCWDFCCCEDCGTDFDVKYTAVEIEIRDNNKNIEIRDNNKNKDFNKW